MHVVRRNKMFALDKDDVPHSYYIVYKHDRVRLVLTRQLVGTTQLSSPQ